MIDRKDVDVVVKIGVPQSLEDLVQMFGRAGRDGRNDEGMFYTHICMCNACHMKVSKQIIFMSASAIYSLYRYPTYSEDDLQTASYWYTDGKDPSTTLIKF